MRFSKYHGLGNDFIMLADPDDVLELTPAFVRAAADRRFGVGGDGVIRVAPGRDGADFFMDYVNSDGSIGEMCGNGIRCLAVFAHEQGLTTNREIPVMTRSGLKTVWLTEDDRVRVDMGAPIFAPADIPVVHDGPHALDFKLDIEGETVGGSCVSMGNPHVVLGAEHPETAPVTTLGPLIEKHPSFPNGTNVEFIRIDARDHITMRVWERGAGETLACGTGACAVAVVARALGEVETDVVVSLAGGDLEISWAGSVAEEAPVYMTGPAVKAFEGELDVDEVMNR